MASDFQRFQKEISTQAVITAIIIATACLAIGLRPIAKGVLLGAVFSVLNFIMIAVSLPMRIDKGRGKRFLICLGSLWVRYALMAVPLVVAFNHESFDFFAAAAGLFAVQAVILVRHCAGLIWADQ